MADLAASMHTRFIVVYWPSRTLLHHEELTRLRDTLRKWCVDKGIVLVDVTEAFLDSQGGELYADTIHPGGDGQRIIAEAVFDNWSGGLGSAP